MNMKRISIFLFAAAALWWGGCEDSSDTDREIPVSVVVLDASLSGGIVLEAGQTQDIAGKVSFLPENATDTAERYESSDPEIASVDESGLLRALQQGSAMVTISVGGKHAHFEVAVEAQRIPVESVTLPDELAGGVTLQPNQTLDIAGKATVLPENATEKTETYASSDTEVAAVSDEGVVTALKEGTATITVTVGGQSASFELTVATVHVEGVTLPDELTNGVSLQLGETLEIAGKAIVAPENATATETTYASSDPNVATVSDEGVVTAVALGTTTITVTVDDHSASFQLTVTKVPVASVTLPEDLAKGISLEPNQTLDIAGKATVLPKNATYKAETYASSDTAVATVSDEGIVTAVAEGTATITVTVDGVEASFVLTVAADVPVAIEKIEIKNGATTTQGSASVVLGTNTTFNLYEHLVLTPANQNEGVKYVAYGSEDIATIDENGIVTCKGVGTVTFVILAKSNTANDFKNAGAKKAFFAVNITDPHDLDRTGWKISEKSHGYSGTGSNDTAAFDDVFDPCFFTTVKGTNFGLSKPAAGTEFYFVVDMQQVQTVNYFRIKHQSCRSTDFAPRWWGFIRIEGSNDGTNFTTVTSDLCTTPDEFKGRYPKNGLVDPNDGDKTANREHAKYRDTPNISFPKCSYRYLKFVANNTSVGTGKSAQIAEFYLGLDE